MFYTEIIVVVVLITFDWGEQNLTFEGGKKIQLSADKQDYRAKLSISEII